LFIAYQVSSALWELRRGGQYYDKIQSISENDIVFRLENAQVASRIIFGNIIWDQGYTLNCILTAEYFYTYGKDKKQTKKLYLQRPTLEWPVGSMRETVMKNDHLKIEIKKTFIFQNTIFIRHRDKEQLMNVLNQLLR
jgi:hypothetical protein